VKVKIGPMEVDVASVGAFECDCCNEVSVGLIVRVPDGGPEGEELIIALQFKEDVARMIARDVEEAIDNRMPGLQGEGFIVLPDWAVGP